MPFTYDPRLRGSGYRDTETGRVISYTTVRSEIDTMISVSQDVQLTLSERVSDGTISPGAWREAVRQEIKDNYLDQYFLGIGGRERMTQADWGRAGSMIKEQYQYLEGFHDQVAAEELSQGQIYARARMYVNSSREAYEKALSIAAEDRPYTEHRWDLGAAEHCDDCVAIASEGWLPIDQPFVSPSTGAETVPGAGDTICLTNCQCHLEYR